MLNNLNLRSKILLMLLLISLITALVMGAIVFTLSKNDLEKESFKKLTAIREMKANQIENYVQFIFDQVISYSEDRMVIEAALEFKNGFYSIEKELNYSQPELIQIDSVIRSYYDTQFLSQLFYRDSTINYFSIAKTELLNNQKNWLDFSGNELSSKDSENGFPNIRPSDFTGDINMEGSSTVSSLVEHIIKLFQEEGAKGSVYYQSTSTLDGIRSLLEGPDIDIVGLSHNLKEKEIKLFEAANQTPLSFRIGTDALVVVAGNGNTFLNNLSLKQLKKAFTSAKMWSDINPEWPDEIINRFVPKEGSGSYNLFVDVILDGDRKALKNVANTTFIKDGEYMKERMKVDPFSVAFFSYNYYESSSLLKILDIEGAQLNNINISRQKYPLIRPLYITTTENKFKENKNLAIFLNFFLNKIDTEVGLNLSDVEYWPQFSNSRILQYQFVANRSYNKGEIDNLPGVLKKNSYNKAHTIYHPIFKNFLDRFGYYDIFIFDTDGNIVYSVKKEVDFGTDIMNGPYSGTNLSNAFRQAIKSDHASFICFEDFKPYLPSYNAPASFIASPIFDGNKAIGVLAFQLPVNKINHIMTDGYEWENVGLGNSGETYLVGSDYLMRNQSRFLIDDPQNYFESVEKMEIRREAISKIKALNSTIGLQPVITKGTKAAVSGETGTKIFKDYRGIDVMSAYKPLNIDLIDWVIMSEIDKSEAFSTIPEMIKNFMYWSVVLFAVIFLLAIYFSQSISRPIHLLSQRASSLAQGNLEDPILIEQNDEIGLLAGNFEKMRFSIKRLIKDLKDINQNLEARVQQRTEELSFANQQIQGIIDSLLDSLIIIDERGIIMSCSPSTTSMFQHSDKELIGKNINVLMPSPHHEEHDGYLEKYRNTGVANIIGTEREVMAKRKDGHIFPVRLMINEVKTENGRIFVGLLVDLTERKKNELRLKSQSAALKSASNAIVITDTTGKVTWVNPAFTKLTGYTWTEVVGKTPKVLKSGKHEKSFYSNMWNTVLDGKVWHGEIINKKKNGDLFYEEMTITPVLSEEEKIVQFVAIKNDISERKKSEENIKASENKFRSIASTASDAIISASEKGIIESWNKAAQSIFGYNENEAIGKPLDIIVPHDYHSSHNEGLKRVASGGKKHVIGKTVELKGQHKDGSTFPIDLSLSTWQEKGQAKFTGIIRDVTERKKYEKAIEKANKRMSSELNVAKDIQMSMLPLIFPAFPQREEIDIFADLIPAREVGGDFYDFHFLDESHIYFVVGDVSGKGVPAALMMAVTKTLLKSRAGNDRSTASILTHVNNEIAKDNDAYMFITVFLAILNTTTGEMVYSNAGHNPSFVIKQNRDIIKLGDLHGPVIGAMEDMTYNETKVNISKEDILFAYTDGVTEAQNSKEEFYSDQRLLDLLTNEKYSYPKDLIKIILDSVIEFQGKADQFDDITLLSLQYLGDKQDTMRNSFSISIKNQLNQMPKVIEAFEQFGEENDLSFGVIQKFNIALDELLNNIISYGFKDNLEHDINVDVELRNERLIIILKDDGVPFNPFRNDPPDTMLSIDERNLGGLGIHIVKNLVDEYDYKRNTDLNIITLIKYNINK